MKKKIKNKINLDFSHQNINAIRYNKFDLGWKNPENKYFYSESKINDRLWSMAPSEKILNPSLTDDSSVFYKLNNEYFRSDDFINTHNEKHVLFAGCSEAEGIGGNIEDAWTKILYEAISNKFNCSGFFNLSTAGWSWRQIVSNSLIYFEKYGYPEIYFILLPSCTRKIPWNKKNKTYDLFFGENNDEEKIYFESLIDFIISWKVFNKLCQQNDVKLIFGTWDTQDSLNLEHFKIFNNFVYLNDDDSIRYVSNHINLYQNSILLDGDLKKRDGHHGKLIHMYWADKILNKYLEIYD